MQGYFTMPYQYLLEENLSDDLPDCPASGSVGVCQTGEEWQKEKALRVCL